MNNITYEADYVERGMAELAIMDSQIAAMFYWHSLITTTIQSAIDSFVQTAGSASYHICASTEHTVLMHVFFVHCERMGKVNPC